MSLFQSTRMTRHVRAGLGSKPLPRSPAAGATPIQIDGFTSVSEAGSLAGTASPVRVDGSCGPMHKHWPEGARTYAGSWDNLERAESDFQSGFAHVPGTRFRGSRLELADRHSRFVVCDLHLSDASPDLTALGHGAFLPHQRDPLSQGLFSLPVCVCQDHPGQSSERFEHVPFPSLSSLAKDPNRCLPEPGKFFP